MFNEIILKKDETWL